MCEKIAEIGAKNAAQSGLENSESARPNIPPNAGKCSFLLLKIDISVELRGFYS